MYCTIGAQESRYNETLNILTSLQFAVSPTIHAPSPRYPPLSLDPPPLARPAAPAPPDADMIYNPSYLMFTLNQQPYYVLLRTAEDLQPSWAGMLKEIRDVSDYSI